MATKEEVKAIANRFYESRQKSPLVKMDRTNFGVGLVLRYLEEVGHPVSAADISRYMSVSTARVAVLLRTMTEKGLIMKHEDPFDARKVQVILSKKGKEHIESIQRAHLEAMEDIIDKIGIERMEEYLDISSQINAILSERLSQKKE